MCDQRCMALVKRQMLDRRRFFVGAGTVGVGLGAAALVGRPVRAAGPLSVTNATPIDLTYTLANDFPTYFGEPGFSSEQRFSFDKHGFNLNTWAVNEHTGTHVDAPIHFSADGNTVDEMPVEQLVAPIAVIDIREKAAADDEAQVTPDDIRAWIETNGPLPEGAVVAMNSGWGARVADGTFRNADEAGTMHFPGFHVEAATMLMEEAEVVGMAVDTLSLDIGSSGDFATHYAWLPTGRFGIENLANVDQLPATGAIVVIGAPKAAGGTGGPSRVIALVPS
ncbi:MAG: cyclase family protein [Geminicoccaceae bacterium]